MASRVVEYEQHERHVKCGEYEEYERHQKLKILSDSTTINHKIAGDVIREELPLLRERFGTPGNAEWVCERLYAKKLLSHPTFRTILERPDKISQAWLEVKRAIECDNNDNPDHCKFRRVLNILSEDSAHQSVVKSLAEKYEEHIKIHGKSIEKLDSAVEHGISVQKSIKPAAEVSGRIQQPASKRLRSELLKKSSSSSSETTQTKISHGNDIVSEHARSTLIKKYSRVVGKIFYDLFVIDTKENVFLPFDDVVAACSCKKIQGLRTCVLIEGENGSGKTTFLRHLAALWATHKNASLGIFSAVLLYQVYAFRDTEGNLNFNLDSQLENDHKLLSDSAGREDILILVDAYWYLPETFLTSCRKYFPNASIVFTGQPDLINKIKSEQIHFITYYFKILGYEQSTINSVVYNLFSEKKSLSRLDDFNRWLDENPFAQAILHRPLYCKMVIELFLKHSLPDHLLNLTELFQRYVLYAINLTLDHPVGFFCDLEKKDYLIFNSITKNSINFPKFNYSQISDKSAVKSFGLIESIEISNGHVLAFVNSSIMAYFMALFYSTSTIKPAYVPFDWPVFVLFVFGLSKTNHEVPICTLRKLTCNGQNRTCCILQQVFFELQSPIISDSIARMACDSGCSYRMQPDPIALYTLGWVSRHYNYYRQNVAFDIPYVFNISKYVYYFCKGISHLQVSPAIDGPLKIPINLRIEHANNNAAECLKYLIDSSICQHLTALIGVSGALDLTPKLGRIAEDDLRTHLSGLRYVSISGEFNSNYRNPLLAVLPPTLHTLALHNKSNLEETDYQFVQDFSVKSLEKIIVDGFLPEFLLSSIQGHDCHLKEIFIGNCVLSPTIIELLIQWLIFYKMPVQTQRRLLLEGEKIISADTAMCIAYTLDRHQPMECDHGDYTRRQFETANELLIRDTAMSVASLTPIVFSVSNHSNLKMSVSRNFRFDLSRFPYINFI